jgi:hypothetical protein
MLADLRNGPYDESYKCKNTSLSLRFRLAGENDIESIYHFMTSRNPELDKNKLLIRTRKEILELNNGIDCGLFVAALGDGVLFEKNLDHGL